jgi:DNA recombination protein RmuC
MMAFWILVAAGGGGLLGWILGIQAGSRKSQLQEAKALAESQVARESLESERARHQQDLQSLRDSFKSFTAEAIQAAHPEFIRQARESFGGLQESYKGDMAQRQEAIAKLLGPLQQQLETYQQRLQQSDGVQSKALGEVSQQLKLLAEQSSLLANETEQFRRVIHSGQARGRWGEEKLRRVVETAGLSPHCDFVEQAQEGDSKPDLLVNLPGSRRIILDAKTPDFTFLDGLEAAEPAVRAETLKLHARKVRETVAALAARRYPEAFEGSLDQVVLFLPSESLFSAALEADPDLIVWAGQKKILLATPATLIGLLGAISLTWQQQSQMENARQIVRTAQELFDRAVVLVRHVEGVGDGLTRALQAYNQAVASYQERLLPAGKRVVELGISGAKGELKELESVPAVLRPLPRAEN